VKVRALIPGLLAASLACAAGCAGEDPLGPAPVRPPMRIADGVFVIDAQSAGIGLHDIDEDRLSLDYAWGPVPAPGEIIVGEERDGYIRRASTVDASENRIIVSTRRAFLSYAVVTGWIDTSLAGGFSASREPRGAAVPATDGLRLDGIALLPAGAGP
jgi:hypothetical protein